MKKLKVYFMFGIMVLFVGSMKAQNVCNGLRLDLPKEYHWRQEIVGDDEGKLSVKHIAYEKKKGKDAATFPLFDLILMVFPASDISQSPEEFVKEIEALIRNYDDNARAMLFAKKQDGAVGNWLYSIKADVGMDLKQTLLIFIRETADCFYFGEMELADREFEIVSMDSWKEIFFQATLDNRTMRSE